MSLTWEHESEHLIVARISGELTREDLGGFQLAAEPLLKSSGRMGFLVILENFAGWATDKGWEDTSFADNNDEFLSRFAIVGEEQWRDQALMFSLAGMRPVEIEYFTDESAAREWIAAA